MNRTSHFLPLLAAAVFQIAAGPAACTVQWNVVMPVNRPDQVAVLLDTRAEPRFSHVERPVVEIRFESATGQSAASRFSLGDIGIGRFKAYFDTPEDLRPLKAARGVKLSWSRAGDDKADAIAISVLGTQSLEDSPDFVAVVPAATRAPAVFGPVDGSIPDGPGLTPIFSNVRLRDFIAEARFKNPALPSGSTWSYGFIFRWSSWEASHFRVFVNSAHRWRAQLFQNDFRELAGGDLTELGAAEGAENLLTLIVRGGEAQLFVNGARVGRFNTSQVGTSGDVGVGNGFDSEAVEGRSIGFNGFTIRR